MSENSADSELNGLIAEAAKINASQQQQVINDAAHEHSHQHEMGDADCPYAKIPIETKEAVK